MTYTYRCRSCGHEWTADYPPCERVRPCPERKRETRPRIFAAHLWQEGYTRDCHFQILSPASSSS